MTETSEDGNYLVRVRAQVMTRDDSSGGWVPLSGGGLANVSVRRKAISISGLQSNNTNGTSISTSNVTTTTSTTNPLSSTTVDAQDHGSSTSPPSASPPSASPPSGSPSSATKRKHEYLIFGKRITDQSVVLSCTIKKDFEYNKVMPTFHHWRTGEKKFGLTFQTAADARAFDKGVRTAVEELLEGLTESTLCINSTDGVDEDVFMALNLPVDPLDPHPSSDTSHGVVCVPNYECSDLDSYKPIHYIGGSTNKVPLSQHPLTSTADIGSDNYSYVHLTTVNHEYLYPVVDDHKSDRSDRHNTESSLKKPDIIVSQPSRNTIKRNVQLRCKHCQELYSEQHNPRGSCEYAPDPIKRGIATISCLSCAQCMLYHCMRDAEGDFAQNPCSCSTEEGCGRRWIGLALLSLIVPCLWIYPPLKAVHWCGMSCGMCGGRHHPME